MGNIIALHNDLLTKTYKHSEYLAFNVSDPKPRNIHKAVVRDRLLHHALYRNLYPFFDRTLITDSFSCRLNKGTHKAMERFKCFSSKVTLNYTRTGWVLKCDISKFFASIDQAILMKIVESYILDDDIIGLLLKVTSSFHSTTQETGLPLGNLTSQLLVNIYMNKFDHWMKHTIKAKYYIRYADDFVIFSEDKGWLLELTPKIANFLEENLKLSLHPNKEYIKTLASGVDFLGWVHFPDHRVIRTMTKKRMLKRLALFPREEVKTSYLGLINYGNTDKIKNKIFSL